MIIAAIMPQIKASKMALARFRPVYLLSLGSAFVSISQVPYSLLQKCKFEHWALRVQLLTQVLSCEHLIIDGHLDLQWVFVMFWIQLAFAPRFTEKPYLFPTHPPTSLQHDIPICQGLARLESLRKSGPPESPLHIWWYPYVQICVLSTPFPHFLYLTAPWRRVRKLHGSLLENPYPYNDKVEFSANDEAFHIRRTGM